eukprot:178320_1
MTMNKQLINMTFNTLVRELHINDFESILNYYHNKYITIHPVLNCYKLNAITEKPYETRYYNDKYSKYDTEFKFVFGHLVFKKNDDATRIMKYDQEVIIQNTTNVNDFIYNIFIKNKELFGDNDWIFIVMNKFSSQDISVFYDQLQLKNNEMINFKFYSLSITKIPKQYIEEIMESKFLLLSKESEEKTDKMLEIREEFKNIEAVYQFNNLDIAFIVPFIETKNKTFTTNLYVQSDNHFMLLKQFKNIQSNINKMDHLLNVLKLFINSKLPKYFFNKINFKWNIEWMPYICERMAVSMNKTLKLEVLNSFINKLNIVEFQKILRIIQSNFIDNLDIKQNKLIYFYYPNLDDEEIFPIKFLIKSVNQNANEQIVESKEENSSDNVYKFSKYKRNLNHIKFIVPFIKTNKYLNNIK